MKRIVKIILALLLTVIMVFPSVSCGSSLSSSDVVAWGADGLQKVLQENSTVAKTDFKLDISLAKGESESGQVILTPKKAVKSVSVELSDLTLSTDSKVTFSKDNVKVYYQKYINVAQKTAGQTNTDCPAGWYPDMLLPMATAILYGENTIEANKNQGLTFDFAAPSNQKAGTYTGTFKVKLDSVTLSLPVTVKVWNFAITEGTGITSYQTWVSTLIYGELSNDFETYKNYYEYFLNEFKMCLMYVPYEEINADSMTTAVQKYWDNPYFLSYAIPITGATWNGSMNSNEFYQYMYSLAIHSTPEKNLFDKAYVYLTTNDEPHAAKDYEPVKANTETINNFKEQIVTQLEQEGFFDKYDASYKAYFIQSLKEVAIICTSNKEDLDSTYYIDTYCPQIQHYATDYMRELYDYYANASYTSGAKWLYTCNEPMYPYTSHHIDDYLLGGRIVRWIQKKFNVEGYLFWGVSEYFDQGNLFMKDPYTNPVGFTSGEKVYNGEGFWVYPGEKYNLNNPLPSLRLISIRDSQEDYDMISYMENLLASLSIYYGEEIDANNVLADIYDTLIFGAKYNTDSANFYTQRELTAKYIEDMQNYGFAVSTSVVSSTKKSYKIYAENGATIKINGNAVQTTSKGDGVYYEYIAEQNGGELNIEVIGNSGKVTRTYNQKKYENATTFNTSDLEDVIEVPDNFVIAKDGAGSVDITIRSKTVSEYEDDFVPYIKLPKIDFGSLQKIDQLSFTVTNTGTVDVILNLTYYRAANISTDTIEKVNLKVGETKTIVVNKLSSNSTAQDTRMLGLCFKFDNIDSTGALCPDRQIKLGDIYYSKA